MNSLNFSVDKERCTACESCISDCPLLVLRMDGELPVISGKRKDMCINCLHCLTICPTAAISINGFSPDDCLELETPIVSADNLERLIRGRRSVRFYLDEDIEADDLNRLLQVAWQAPTGVNARSVLFTVVDNKQTMDKLRSSMMERLDELVREEKLPEHLKFFGGFAKLWKEKGIDTIFRGAPHMIITSAPKDCPCPEQDCVIALSYFELFAQSLGVGTVWNGLAKWAFTALMPEFTKKLKIPNDHTFGYVMAFGKPAVEYPRSVPLRSAAINKVVL